MHNVLLLLPALLLAAPAAEAQRGIENRCGWIVNPSPGNYWLVDRDARRGWLISAQGGYRARGMDLLPDFTVSEWVESRPDSSYGHGCACMQVRTDPRNRQITRIHSVRQVPIAQCRRDRRLPPPE
jgi:hypothetical protein